MRSAVPVAVGRLAIGFVGAVGRGRGFAGKVLRFDQRCVAVHGACCAGARRRQALLRERRSIVFVLGGLGFGAVAPVGRGVEALPEFFSEIERVAVMLPRFFAESFGFGVVDLAADVEFAGEGLADVGGAVGGERDIFVQLDLLERLQALAGAGVCGERDQAVELFLFGLEDLAFGDLRARAGAVGIVGRVVLEERPVPARVGFADWSAGGGVRVVEGAGFELGLGAIRRGRELLSVEEEALRGEGLGVAASEVLESCTEGRWRRSFSARWG